MSKIYTKNAPARLNQTLPLFSLILVAILLKTRKGSEILYRGYYVVNFISKNFFYTRKYRQALHFRDKCK